MRSKKYETPKIEVIELGVQEVIATSVPQGGSTNGGGAVLAPKRDEFWEED